MECFDYEDGYNTAGQPIMRRRCFCNFTACQKHNKRTPLKLYGYIYSATRKPETLLTL